MNKLNIALLKTIFAFVAAMIFADTAAAQNKTSTWETDSSEAKIHFKQGIEFYRQEEYERAAIEFARAYELKPTFKILFNIAQAENMLEHHARALSAYKKYLADGGDDVPPERRQFVEKEIGGIEYRVGQLTVKNAAEGSMVLVDGEAFGETPLKEPILLNVGKHDIEVVKNNDRLFRQVYRIAGGQHVVIDLAEQEPGPGTGDAAPPVQPATQSQAASPEEISRANPIDAKDSGPDAPPSKRSARKIIAWTSLSVGAAAAVGAVVTGAISLSAKNEIEAGCENDRCPRSEWESQFDKVENLSLTTDILIGVAAVGVVTGVVLLLVKPKFERASKTTVGFRGGREGAAITLTGRF